MARVKHSAMTAVCACVAAYRREVRFLANQPLLSRSYQRLNVDRLHETVRRGRCGARSHAPQNARDPGPAISRCRASPRSATGRRYIVDRPPLITRVSGAEASGSPTALDKYLITLAPHWRRVVAGYTLVDIAHKVVGVGSVGLRSLCRAARGQQSRRCGVPAAETGTALGGGPVSSMASRPGTRIRDSGSWSTSKRCKRSAIRCWAGRRLTACSTTSGSSAT